jgi:hypothetical protein
MQPGRPIHRDFHQASWLKPLAGREQNSSAAHVQCLSRSTQLHCLRLQDSVPDILFHREPAVSASLNSAREISSSGFVIFCSHVPAHYDAEVGSIQQ